MSKRKHNRYRRYGNDHNIGHYYDGDRDEHHNGRREHAHDRGAQSFRCAHCGQTITLDSYGTKNRNHCPYCLHSLHVDVNIGDRSCDCRGVMEPIAVWVQPDGEWSLIHRCKRCGTLRANRVAGDDSEAALLSLAALPMASLPFPLTGVIPAITMPTAS